MALFLRKNPELQEGSYQEIERLRNNIELFQSFRLNTEKRKLLEKDSIGTDISIYHKTYKKIKQLTVSLEVDLEKEKYEYEELVIQNKNSIV